jgi:dipeptidyl aminopeptidase/acylaminoacyl peptidase
MRDEHEEYETRPSNTRTLGMILGILGGVLIVVLLVCGGVGYLIYHAVSQINLNFTIPQVVATNLELQEGDYAEARAQFKTNLIRKGQAPQPFQELELPDGVTQVEFPSGELRLKAWINAPKKVDQGKKRPAVLFLHGGFAFDPEDWEMVEPYLDAGFIVMAPMLRGENGQPGSFTLYYDEVDDVLAAAEYLAKQPYVDAEKIYLAGHSAGGTLTMLATMTSKRFRAAASFSGSPNQTTHALTVPGPAVFDTNDSREIQMRSPLAYATSFKCPIRLYYGDQEPLLPEQNEETARRAQTRGLDVQAVQVAGDHMSAADPAIRQSIEFFKKK